MTKRERDEIVVNLERWYFGIPFSDYKEKTEVGEWRDILNECASKLVEANAEVKRLQKQWSDLTSSTINLDELADEHKEEGA